ncbi:MAG: bile acid:sodium symporter family protein [Gammaproteobacteria bacterium]|nr:bile acid:sodium symporter family protein [Gammaproteobacteria bacterium]
MFAVGITLVPADFKRLFEQPRAVIVGLVGQLVMLPLVAWGLAFAFRLPPEMAVGLVILGACPGGASSALVTYLARGTAALSVTLTATTSLVALLSMPLIVQGALHAFMGTDSTVDVSVAKLVRGVFFISTVPVVLGMVLRAWRPQLVDRTQAAIGRIATTLFVLIVIATFLSQRQVLFDNLSTVGPAAASLNLIVMLAGAGAAIAMRLDRRDAIAIASECGLQNAGLGIFIAINVLATPSLAVPSVVYALLMNVGAFGLIAIARRWVRS